MDESKLRRGLAYNAGENIARLAGMHLIPQARLATATGLSRQAINNLVKGRSQASTNTLRMVATFFGIGVDDLLAEPGECLITAAQAFEQAPARAFHSDKHTRTT